MASTEYTSTFSGIKYLGSVEIIRSLYNIHSSLRTDVIGFAINKILQRYSRSNLWQNNCETEIAKLQAYVGRSPMSPWHQHYCDIHLTPERIIVNSKDVNSEDGRCVSRIFDHPLGNISVAAKDICIPNLWCYVSKTSSFGQCSDRHLFLFECIDELQSSKLHDVNIRRFNNQPIPSSRPLRVELPPLHPHSTSAISTPPALPSRRTKPTTDDRYLKFV